MFRYQGDVNPPSHDDPAYSIFTGLLYFLLLAGVFSVCFGLFFWQFVLFYKWIHNWICSYIQYSWTLFPLYFLLRSIFWCDLWSYRVMKAVWERCLTGDEGRKKPKSNQNPMRAKPQPLVLLFLILWILFLLKGICGPLGNGKQTDSEMTSASESGDYWNLGRYAEKGGLNTCLLLVHFM